MKVVWYLDLKTNKEVYYVIDLEKDEIKDEIFKGVTSVIHLAGYAHDLKNSPSKLNKFQKLNYEASIALAIAAFQKGIKDFTFLGLEAVVSQTKLVLSSANSSAS